MSRGGSRNSVVLTKYGERPLIDIPPLSLSKSRADEDIPTHMFKVPGKRSTHVFHQPPRSPQVSLTAPQPQQRRYQEPLMEQPTYYNHPTYSQDRNYYQPQYQSRAPVPAPLPPPPQVQQSRYSNLAPDSNLVPYNYTHYRPQQQQQPLQPIQQYNTSYGSVPQGPPPVPNGAQSNEVHIYYGPNGERLPGPLPGPNYPTDFTLEGTLEYGKLVSVKVRNSNISYREIPDFVFRDLMKTYGMVERTDVKIVAQGGEYNIYASPSMQNESVTNNPGYIYEQQQPLRQIPVPAHSYDHEGGRAYDPFTKIYRYGRNSRSLRERYPPVSKRDSSLNDINEDFSEDSEPMTRDTRR